MLAVVLAPATEQTKLTMQIISTVSFLEYLYEYGLNTAKTLSKAMQTNMPKYVNNRNNH